LKLQELYHYILLQINNIYEESEASNIAFMLLEKQMNIKRHEVFTSDREVDVNQLQLICRQTNELIKHKPVQQILGNVEFLDCNITINEAVLIPRPETEELVCLFISENKNAKGKLLDIGTGSGCIAIALAKQIKSLEVHAMDNSLEALKIAKSNADMNEVAIDIHQKDFLEISEEIFFPEGFDFIISNPPYVTESEKRLMKENVLMYEPASALFVPDDQPLLFYEHILLFAKTNLKDKGKIYLEINEKFGQETANLFNEANFKNVRLIKDINEKDRFIVVEKK